MAISHWNNLLRPIYWGTVVGFEYGVLFQLWFGTVDVSCGLVSLLLVIKLSLDQLDALRDESQVVWWLLSYLTNHLMKDLLIFSLIGSWCMCWCLLLAHGPMGSWAGLVPMIVPACPCLSLPFSAVLVARHGVTQMAGKWWGIPAFLIDVFNLWFISIIVYEISPVDSWRTNRITIWRQRRDVMTL